MKHKILNLDQLYDIYIHHMSRDFPEDEIKPFPILEYLMSTGEYLPMALYKDEQMIGYALFITDKGRSSYLLDYYAVLPQYRSCGYGSEILHYMQSLFSKETDGIIIECEDPDFAPDRDQALRRLKFYRNAGAKSVEIKTKLFGVRYLVFILSCADKDYSDSAETDISHYYRRMVPEGQYDSQVEIYL